MGPFCPEQGISSHETVMDLTSTDDIATLLTDDVNTIDNVEQYNNCEYENIT